MLKRKFIIILIFIFLIGLLFYSFLLIIFSDKIVIGNTLYKANELEGKTISFNIDSLSIGKYDLIVYFKTYDIATLQQSQEIINFDLTVQIRYGNKLKEKIFTKAFKHDNSKGVFYLFDVPNDIFWKKKNVNMEILIKDINFDEEFIRYFEELIFEIVCYKPLEHKINIVDGELIQRNNGFKNW